MKELQAHAIQNKLSIAQVVMANEVAVSGKTRGGDQRLRRQDLHGDGQHRQGRTEGAVDDAARSDQAQDQGRRRLRAGDAGQVVEQRGLGVVSGVCARRLGGERARPPRGHGADRADPRA